MSRVVLRSARAKVKRAFALTAALLRARARGLDGRNPRLVSVRQQRVDADDKTFELLRLRILVENTDAERAS